MRRIDTLRKIMKKQKHITNIRHLNVDELMLPGDIYVTAVPIIDPDYPRIAVGIDIEHGAIYEQDPSKYDEYDDPDWTYSEEFIITPPDRLKRIF